MPYKQTKSSVKPI